MDHELTVAQGLAWARTRLQANGGESFALDVSLLAAHALGLSREQILARGPEFFPSKPLKEFRALVQKRLEGWNMAYLLGTKEFMGLEFKVDPRVLVPRPDTETLVEWALEILGHEAGYRRVLDLCTGSGAIAGAVKAFLPSCSVGASDLSEEALSLARENWGLLNLSIDSWQSDLFTQVPGTWDLILTNPPYLTPEQTRACVEDQHWVEPALALNGFGDDGLDLIRALIPQAWDALNSGGSLLIEAASVQMPSIHATLEKAGFAQISVRNDLESRPRVIGCMKI